MTRDRYPRRLPGWARRGCPRLGLAAPAVLAFAALASLAAAAPYRPTHDGEILERLPSTDQRVTASLRERQAALRRNPDDLALALDVARTYVGLGRAEGDPRYYGYAQAALAPWWSRTEPPADVLVMRAVLKQAGHDFAGALGDLELALRRQPGHVQAWLSRAVIQQVQGRFGEAADSCRKLVGRVEPIIVVACLSAVESLTGRAEASYRRLSEALAGAPQARPGLRQWALTILGEIAARTGKAAVAQAHFRDALSLGERSTYLLGALADLLLDQGRFAAVRDLLRDETRADPLLLRLALAEAALGDRVAAEHRATLEARFAASRLRGDSRHLREEARFTLQLLERPAEALRLALENWQTQREPWDARLVLAAARAAGDAGAATPVLEWLEENGMEAMEIARLAAALGRERG